MIAKEKQKEMFQLLKIKKQFIKQSKSKEENSSLLLFVVYNYINVSFLSTYNLLFICD